MTTTHQPLGTEALALPLARARSRSWRAALAVTLGLSLLFALLGGAVLQRFKAGLLENLRGAQQILACEMVAGLPQHLDGDALAHYLDTHLAPSLRAHRQLYLLDAEGHVAYAAARKPSAATQALADSPAFGRSQHVPVASSISEDTHGDSYLLTFRRVPDSDVTLVLGSALAPVLAPYQSLGRQALLALLLACVAVLMALRSRAQELFAEIERNLAQLRGHNQELSRQRRELACQVDRDCRFFQEASHDFRQRLHAMQLLLHTVQQCDAHEGRVLLGKTLYVVLNLQAYVRDFLDLARLRGDTAPPCCQVLQAQSLLQELELGFEDVALQRGLDLRVRASALSLHSDHHRLARVMENLLANACKFARGRVLVAARRTGRGVALEVWDDGPGIAKQDRQRIFSPYYQAADGPCPPEGVGLGLAIVLRLCAILGHEVSVHERHGLTLVRVHVPGDTAQP
ncbi:MULTISPECIES: sensor histidine kinase [Pseudomonas]|uniref:sensor histidine kinase n=1 Tax=Pseudomonas TaxID=286 RepID=UPI00111A959A|nr:MULTISPECIES: HAMP domain-containing sensor histidine kinase [Pseudomonas]MDF9756294.1 signal transduction histidine kinase [Pseudomonas hunanensis]UVL17413.1 HAMP domain-containing histidine kinase [Pseudomonas sp. B21-044]UVM14774.1 HAMP domain-containing histidine kinase [Pseudomonas sp. B21-023]